MLPFFRLGVGGPVAGGRQYMPWIHVDDLVGIYLAALDGEDWSGAVNATAPDPATNKEFSQGARPRAAPAGARPGARPGDPRALRGDGEIVVTGQRAVPERAQALGYDFAHPELDEALRSALAG